MSLSDYEVSWINPFECQDINPGNSTKPSAARGDHSTCRLSDLPQPAPQRSSIDAGSCCDQEAIQEHHLEQALRDLAESGELENFLRDNTISLKEIQDDTSVRYGSASELCDFQSKQRVRRHSIGTADEIIRCPYPGCNKIFNRSYNFKSHYKIHSGEKPFKCNYCELNFARCHDLRRHEKIHQPSAHIANKCELCFKTFSRPDALNRHIKMSNCQNLLYKRSV